MPAIICGVQRSYFKGNLRTPLEGNGSTQPTRRGQAGNNRPTRAPTPRTMAAPNPSSPPTSTLATWARPAAPSRPSTARERTTGRGGGGFSSSLWERATLWGMSEGVANTSAVWGVREPGYGAKQQGSHTSRTLTPITTVSSPLNLGMNLSPRRISASLRGRNRHITLMLHSAGSAISAGGREGERGRVGGRGSAGQGRRPRTAPPAAFNEASQQVIANSAGWAARAAPPPGRFL